MQCVICVIIPSALPCNAGSIKLRFDVVDVHRSGLFGKRRVSNPIACHGTNGVSRFAFRPGWSAAVGCSVDFRSVAGKYVYLECISEREYRQSCSTIIIQSLRSAYSKIPIDNWSFTLTMTLAVARCKSVRLVTAAVVRLIVEPVVVLFAITVLMSMTVRLL
ncbi:hypothetical protein EVAR_81960_1 [Eumeta japonica]|uniref:Uncharacterized protein n=1 Tax=Eumeta variegata TaxID=151549 RepID=A0A4C1VVC9_EUMVA|nr:hypothetical protein EVAR_81960_1 [Eumeta japonica]